MYSGSTLNSSAAVSAVELFQQGFTAKSVAISLDLARPRVAGRTEGLRAWGASGGAAEVKLTGRRPQLRGLGPSVITCTFMRCLKH